MAAHPPVSSASTGWQIEVFAAVFLPIQIIAVALRLYTRRMIKVGLGWDDALVLVSLVCQIALAGIEIAAVEQGGLGHQIGYVMDTNPAQLVLWRKYLTAMSIFYFLTLNIPKLAILILYHKLFPVVAARIAVYGIGFVLVGSTIGTFVASLTACRPLSANWDVQLQQTGQATCIDKNALYLWSSIPSIVTDVAMLVYPLPLIWKLHTNTRMKIGLTATFAFGSIGLITAIFRFRGYLQSAGAARSFSGTGQLIWSNAEPGVYLISACMLTYRPLVERLGCGRLKASWNTPAYPSDGTVRQGTHETGQIKLGRRKWSGGHSAAETSAILPKT